MVLSDNQNVVFDVFVYYILWFFGIFFGVIDIQIFTLIESVIYQFLVFINFIVIDGNDFVWLCWEIMVQEFVEFMFVNEVNVGRVFFFCGDQIKIFSNFMYLWFFQFVDWEQVLCNLFMVECIKEVVLVFIVVQIMQQVVFVIDIGLMYVMIGSDIIGI